MRILAVLVTLIALAFTTSAQSKRFAGLRFTGNFDFRLKAPGQDDAGVGLQADAILFAHSKVHLVVSGNAHRLIGDKNLFIGPDAGRINKPGTVYGMQAGPEYMIVPQVALFVKYGVFWHSIREVKFNVDDGFTTGFCILPGKKKSFVMQLSRTWINRDITSIRYYTFGVGYKFL